jgi:hypothetical protein
MTALIDPVDVEVADRNGDKKTFTIGHIPAVQSREIIAQYPLSALPKLGDYQVNEQMFFKMMAYVEVHTDGGKIMLKTKELINNHCDFVQSARLEGLMFQKNWGFFLQGPISSFSQIITQKAQALISQMLTLSSRPSPEADKPPSTT